jgi:hypothetical protein
MENNKDYLRRKLQKSRRNIFKLFKNNRRINKENCMKIS